MKPNFTRNTIILVTLISAISIFSAYEAKTILTLENELDACKNNPKKLLQSAKTAFDNKDYGKVIIASENLNKEHSDTPEATEAKSLATKANILISEENKLKKEREAIAKAAEDKRLDAEREEKERQLAKALSNMNKESDDMRGMVFYNHKDEPSALNSYNGLDIVSALKRLELYIATQQTGNVSLRLKNTYVAEDWLFIESYRIKADDAIYDITTDYGHIERDNSAGKIIEWLDEKVSSEREIMLRVIASSKNAVIRYNGKQYYKDRTIYDSEKKRIRDVLTAYEALSKYSK
jgi:hypothetical protein